MRIILAAALLFASSAQAGQIGDWFKSLRQPVTGMSCCDISDCSAIDDSEWRVSDGDYEVMLFGQWVRVPEDKVLHRSDNPTGKGVLCASPTVVFCFDPGPLS